MQILGQANTVRCGGLAYQEAIDTPNSHALTDPASH